MLGWIRGWIWWKVMRWNADRWAAPHEPDDTPSSYQYKRRNQRQKELIGWAFSFEALQFVDTNSSFLWIHSAGEKDATVLLLEGAKVWLHSQSLWAPPPTTHVLQGPGAPVWNDEGCSSYYESLLFLHLYFLCALLGSWWIEDSTDLLSSSSLKQYYNTDRSYINVLQTHRSMCFT